LYPFSPRTAEETGFVMACDTFRVESGEALDMNVDERGECYDLEFENPAEKLLIKQYMPDMTNPETDTRSYMRLQNPKPSLSSQMTASFSFSKFGFNPIHFLADEDPSNITIIEAPSAAPTSSFGWPTEQPTLFPTPWPTSSWKPTKNCKFLGFFCEDHSTFAPTPAPSAHPTLLFTMSPVPDLPPELGGPPTDDEESSLVSSTSVKAPLKTKNSSKQTAVQKSALKEQAPSASEPATAAKLENMINMAIAEVRGNLRGNNQKGATELQELPAVVKPQRDGRSVLCRTVGIGCKDGESPDPSSGGSGGTERTNGTEIGEENPFEAIPAQPNNFSSPENNFTGTTTDPFDVSNSTSDKNVPSANSTSGENVPTAQLTYMPSSILTYMPSSANTLAAAKEATEREQWNIQVDQKKDDMEKFNKDVDRKNEEADREEELSDFEEKQSEKEVKVKAKQKSEEEKLDARQRKELHLLREKIEKKEEALSEEDERAIENMIKRQNATKAELQEKHEEDLEEFENRKQKRVNRKRKELWGHNETDIDRDVVDGDDGREDDDKEDVEVDDQEIPDDDKSWENHRSAGAHMGDGDESHRKDEQNDDTPETDDAEEAKDEATDDISDLERDDDADATSSVPKNEKNIHDDNDISDSKEETSIIINNKIVKKGSTHKTLKAREGTTSVKDWDPTWGDKLQQEAQEAKQAVTARLERHRKSKMGNADKEVHDHAGFYSPAEATVKAEHEKMAKIKKDRRDNVMRDAIEDKDTQKLKELWSDYAGSE